MEVPGGDAVNAASQKQPKDPVRVQMLMQSRHHPSPEGVITRVFSPSHARRKPRISSLPAAISGNARASGGAPALEECANNLQLSK